MLFKRLASLLISYLSLKLICCECSSSSVMSSRYHRNPYPDYSPRNKALYLEDGKLERNLVDRISALLPQLTTKIRDVIGELSRGNDYSIYTGYTGNALLYHHIYRKYNDKDALQTAVMLCQRAKSQLKMKRVSFLNGDAGVLALSAVVFYMNGLKPDAVDSVDRLVNMVDAVVMDKSVPDELLYGRVGYLYALMFADKQLGPRIINPDVIRKVVEAILQSGVKLAKNRRELNVPLAFEWHDKNYLGAAHGVSGILYILLCVRNFLTDYELTSLIRPTINWLMNFRYSSGNFFSSVGSETDRLVQWCHGAPGFVHLFTLASQVYNDSSYMQIALECGDVVWERGLVSKGYSICHGVAGNAYTFLHLYKMTGDELHLYRAACFADWCTKYPKYQGLQPDRPFSLFEGIAGVSYFLVDVQDPMNSSFPAYEV